jgi:hypothetical protein
MIFTLSSRANRLLLVAAVGASCFLFYFSIRVARAAHATGLNTGAGYERAVRLEPSNPRNWYLLGRFYQYDFEQPNPDAALHAFLVARSLDPVSADTLLDLATNYDESGKTAEARAAYLEAKRVYPLSAEVLWRYGNFLLRNNEIEAAFPEIRKAVELEPKRGPEAFSRCHRVDPDVNEILERVIPPILAPHLDIMDGLASEGQLDDALQVWQRAKTLPGKLMLIEVYPLANGLVQALRTKEAVRFWQEATAKVAAPISPDPPGSIIWDGSFESGYFGGGYSWHFSPSNKGVLIKIDASEKHSGAQSLKVMFTGNNNVFFSDLCHWIPFEPNTSYLFSAWVKTKSLTSDQGIRFGIYGSADGKMTTASTEEVHGDQPWTKLTLAWTSPPEISAAQVCAMRSQSDQPNGQVAGIAWIDDVSMTPMGSGSNR